VIHKYVVSILKTELQHVAVAGGGVSCQCAVSETAMFQPGDSKTHLVSYLLLKKMWGGSVS